MPNIASLESLDNRQTPHDRDGIVFFDGVCGLCNRFVNFVLPRDQRGELRFAPLQGETAQILLPVEDRENLDTVIFFEDGKCWRRSAAVVRILTHLSLPWSMLATCLWLVPGPIRDVGYRTVSRFRYRLFGKSDVCRLPTPDEAARFLP